MKPPPSSHRFVGSCSRTGRFTLSAKVAMLLAVASLSVFSLQSAQASTQYWDTNGNVAGAGTAVGVWGTNTYWTTDPTGLSATAAYTPNSDVFFSAGASTGPASLSILGTQAANSLTFTQSTNLAIGSGTALQIAAGGITLNSGSGTVSVTSLIQLTASQNWANNDDSLLTVGAVTNSSNATPITLTVNGTGTGGTTFGGGISDGGATGTTGITVNTTNGITSLNNVNTYTGGLNIQQGTVKLGNAAGAGAGLVTIGNTGTNGILDLNGASRTINSLATGGIAGNQKITNGAGTAAILNYTGATTSTFGGVIENGGGGGTTALTLNNAAAKLTLSGANIYTGATTVTAGILNIQNGTAFGTHSAITVANLATLQIQGGITGGSTTLSIVGGGATGAGATGALENVSGVNSYAGLVQFTAAGNTTISSVAGTLNLTNTGALGSTTGAPNLILTGSGDGSIAAFFTGGVGSTAGAGQLTKNGAGAWRLTGANTYTGNTIINGGTLTLGGVNGSNAGSGFYTLTSGSMVLDNTGASSNNSDRIKDTASFTLGGGSFVFQGSDQSATNSTETINALSGFGNSTITVSYGGTNSATLTAASLTHTAGQGTNLVNGANLGKDSASTTSVGRFITTTAPLAAQFVGTTAALATGDGTDGNGAGAAKNTKVVTYLVGESTLAAAGKGTASGTANTFVTYNATTGYRPLNPTDEFTNNAITATNNIYVTTGATNTANTSINSLVINGGDVTINDGFTLTNTSGALLFASNNTIKPSTSTGAYTSATENQITVNAGITGTISAVISGTQALTKSGEGTLVLQAANTYNANTNVVNGTLQLDGASVITKGTISVGGYTQVTSASLTETTANAISGTASVAFNSGTSSLMYANNYSGTTLISLATVIVGSSGSLGTGTISNAQSQGTIQVGASGITLANNISLSGLTLNVTGANDLTLSGAITGNIAPSGTKTISNTSTGLLTLSGPIYVSNSAASSQTLNFNGNTNISGAISDFNGSGVAGSVSFANGTTTLSGANTYTGKTTITSGTVQFAKEVSLYNNTPGSWTAANINVKSGATLALNVGGSGEFSATDVNTLLGNISVNSSTSTGLQAGAILGFDTTNAALGAFTQGNAIGDVTGTNPGAIGVTKLGTNTLVFDKANTYTGKTTITGGTLQFAKKASLYNGTTASWTAANLTAASGATLALSVGGTNEFGVADVNTLLTNISVATTGAGLQAGSKIGFDTTNATGGTFTQGNVIANSTGATGGAIGVTKLGTNTLVFDKANTYTGGTIVSAGTLLVSNTTGSGTGTGSVSVSSGAILGGNGTISGATILSGSLRPGNSIGTLNIANNVTWNSGQDWVFELGAGNTSDLLNITGDFTKGTGSLFNFDFLGATDTGIFTLVDWSGSTTFALSDFSYSNLGGGNAGSFQITGSQLEFVTVAVPEPATWGLLGFGLATVLVLRRRQSRE